MDEHDIKDIAEQMNQATRIALASGSLVFSQDGKRKTEPDLAHQVPTDNPFGKLNERDYLKQLGQPTPKKQKPIAGFL